MSSLKLDREPGEANAPWESPEADLPSKPTETAGLSPEALQAAHMALLDPQLQVRSAVALQIGQLNQLAAMLQRFQDQMEASGSEWAGWIERASTTLEATGRSLEGLSSAKREQEELLLNLKQGWISAKDEDTARLEGGLRNLASASQELKAAVSTVTGTGKQFAAMTQESLQTLERRLPELGDLVGRKLELPIQHLQRALKPLTWIGVSLCLLVILDVLIRFLK